MPSIKKILIFIFILVLLITIPVSIYLISQQKTKTEVASTTLTLVPVTQSVNAGDNLSLDVSMDPGKNSVSVVKLLIAYDSTKLATVEGGFVPNTSVFPSVVEGPTYANGTISVTLSVGGNSPTIQTTTKVATLNFKALEATDTAPSQITFNTQTNVLSANGTSQNVLSSASPATVNITAPLETPTPFPTAAETITPTPTAATANQDLAVNTVNSTGPICISFTADRPTTGTVPFNVNFTLVATDSAAVISKATFDFGDGQKQDITSVNGLGNNPTTVNALTSHIYEAAGTFAATGSITDVNGNISDKGICSLTVNVNTESTSTETAQLTPVLSPLPAAGSNSFTTILAFAVVLTLAGVFLLFAL